MRHKYVPRAYVPRAYVPQLHPPRADSPLAHHPLTYVSRPYAPQAHPSRAYVPRPHPRQALFPRVFISSHHFDFARPVARISLPQGHTLLPHSIFVEIRIEKMEILEQKEKKRCICTRVRETEREAC